MPAISATELVCRLNSVPGPVEYASWIFPLTNQPVTGNGRFVVQSAGVVLLDSCTVKKTSCDQPLGRPDRPEAQRRPLCRTSPRAALTRGLKRRPSLDSPSNALVPANPCSASAVVSKLHGSAFARIHLRADFSRNPPVMRRARLVRPARQHRCVSSPGSGPLSARLLRKACDPGPTFCIDPRGTLRQGKRPAYRRTAFPHLRLALLVRPGTSEETAQALGHRARPPRTVSPRHEAAVPCWTGHAPDAQIAGGRQPFAPQAARRTQRERPNA